MIIEQTIEIPADRRVHLDFEVPRSIPAGRVGVTVTFSAPEADEVEECPQYQHIPNAETIAAIKEGRAMMRGEIPSPTFYSLEELLTDLRS